MADDDANDFSQTLLPHYDTSSTGSLHLSDHSTSATVLAFETTHRKKSPRRSAREILQSTVAESWRKFSLKRTLVRNVPFLKTVRRYRLGRDLVNDLVAGVTVGVTMIPQGMAFALVASLPPIVGLYMAFFASLVYALLGTGRHLSWNCVAVLAILTGNLLDGYDARVRQDLHQQLLQRELAVLGEGGVGAEGDRAVLGGLENQFSGKVRDGFETESDGPGDVLGALGTTHSGLDTVQSSPSRTRQGFEHKNNDVGGSTSALNKVFLALPTIHANVTSDVNITSTNSTSTHDLEEMVTDKKLELACGVTLLSGVIVAVLGKAGLGQLACFMSDSLVISFTVGVAFHVLVGQLGVGLGLHLPTRSGAFKIFLLLADMVGGIQQVNVATSVTFAVCVLIIYVVKRFVNERYADKLMVPVPVELVVLIVATAVNATLKMNESYSVDIVAEIPLGVPAPRLPKISAAWDYLYEGLIIILVSFTQTVALGKIMALKHGYRIDPDQEMFSLGVASVVCSFFSGFIPGASITCTVLQDSTGSKTQVSSLFASAVVCLVILFLGPYFYFLPRCVLAAVVILNIRSMFWKLLTVPALWRKSRGDAVIWVSTCVATVVLDTDLGLFVGLAVCVLGVLVRARISPVEVVGRISSRGFRLWKSVEKYHGTREMPDVKVLRVTCDFYFVNAELITDSIIEKSGINPTKLKKKAKVLCIPEPDKDNAETLQISGESNHIQNHATTTKQDASDTTTKNTKPVNQNLNGLDAATTAMNANPRLEGLPFSTLVLDLSGVSFIDMMGVVSLETLTEEYGAIGVMLFLTQVQDSCLKTLSTTGFLAKHSQHVLLSTDDVLHNI